MPKKRKASKRFSTKKFVLNCVPSTDPEQDWTFEDAVDAQVIRVRPSVPTSIDLRDSWWTINDQGKTGACVGFATAYGVLRWHYVRERKIKKTELPSARFIWMANKETDELTRYPTTFIETAGTQTKLALRVARKYGCVLEDLLPMNGKLSTRSRAVFYALAARLRLSNYHNLGRNLDNWRKWLAFKGPILTRLGVDRTWDRATQNKGILNVYQPDTVRGGHAGLFGGLHKGLFYCEKQLGNRLG